MKINFDQPILEVTGEQAVTHINGTEQTVKTTLKDLCVMALNYPEKGLKHTDIVSRGMLAIRLSSGGDQDISGPEITDIYRLGSLWPFSPIWMAQLWELLEGRENPIKKQ